MRVVAALFAGLVAFGAVAAVIPAQAQESSTRIIIRKLPPRSYLDPGTVVKPGSTNYLNYVYAVQPRYPSYGDDSTITGTRYPLPGRFDLPRY